MPDIIRCNRCIIPASLPSVKLDSNGLCNYCRNYESIYANLEKTKERRKRTFNNIINRVKRLNRPYDCLITLSGGKDSIFSLYLCSKIYNLKCLSITFDNGFLSNHAKENIKNAIRITGTDHIFYAINRNNMLELFKHSIVKSGTLCSPCMKGIEVSEVIASFFFKIPIIVHGHSEKIAYAVYPELSAKGDIFGNILKGSILEREANQMLVGDKKKYRKAIIRLLFPWSYNVPHTFSFHDYFDIPREEIFSTISREMNWVAPSNTMEHMDCLIHEVPFYMMKLKFPQFITKKTAFLAGQVRFGAMGRNQALEVENMEIAEGRKPAILGSLLSELCMSEDEFEFHSRDWRKADIYRNKTKSFMVSLYHRFRKG